MSRPDVQHHYVRRGWKFSIQGKCPKCDEDAWVRLHPRFLEVDCKKCGYFLDHSYTVARNSDSVTTSRT